MTKRSNLSQTSAPPGRPPTSLQPPRTLDPHASRSDTTSPTCPPTAHLHPITADNGAIPIRSTTRSIPAPHQQPARQRLRQRWTTTPNPGQRRQRKQRRQRRRLSPRQRQPASHHPRHRHQPIKLSHTTQPDMVSNNCRRPTHPPVDKVPAKTTCPQPRPP
jgi:hypothetical protein